MAVSRQNARSCLPGLFIARNWRGISRWKRKRQTSRPGEVYLGGCGGLVFSVPAPSTAGSSGFDAKALRPWPATSPAGRFVASRESPCRSLIASVFMLRHESWLSWPLSLMKRREPLSAGCLARQDRETESHHLCRQKQYEGRRVRTPGFSPSQRLHDSFRPTSRLSCPTSEWLSLDRRWRGGVHPVRTRA